MKIYVCTFMQIPCQKKKKKLSLGSLLKKFEKQKNLQVSRDKIVKRQK